MSFVAEGEVLTTDPLHWRRTMLYVIFYICRPYTHKQPTVNSLQIESRGGNLYYPEFL